MVEQFSKTFILQASLSIHATNEYQNWDETMLIERQFKRITANCRPVAFIHKKTQPSFI